MDPVDAARLALGLIVVKDLILVACVFYIWYRVRRLEHGVAKRMEETEQAFGDLLSRTLSLALEKREGAPTNQKGAIEALHSHANDFGKKAKELPGISGKVS